MIPTFPHPMVGRVELGGSLVSGKILLEGDEQSGTDHLLLEGDEQTGTDVLLYTETI